MLVQWRVKWHLAVIRKWSFCALWKHDWVCTLNYLKMCTNTCSWNVTEIQLVHQQLAKCYYLKSQRKGAHSPKEKIPPCFSDVLQQGKQRPPRWSVRSTVMVPGPQPGFLLSMTMQVLPRLFTYFFSVKTTQYQHYPALVSEQFKH